MHGPHIVENPLAVLVNVVELHVVDIVLPGRIDDPVVLPVAPSARHVALDVEGHGLSSSSLMALPVLKIYYLDVDGREGGVGKVVVLDGHVVVAAHPDAAWRPETGARFNRKKIVA